MSYILHINTALDQASVSLAHQQEVIAEQQNNSQKEHASFLQVAIGEMMQKQGISLKSLSALAVINGPGSYTGLRVGMSGAKGICFALSLPLITVNTLEWMAAACKGEDADLFCPMIDARRMEVFTALYDQNQIEVTPPTSLVLDPASFSGALQRKKILFFGNGAEKFSTLVSHPNACYKSIIPGVKELAEISWSRYQEGVFADLTYAEPFYLKEFYTTAKSI
jgi:tRNA threonylcarbamoyladenosine biosynthesis protein TsaB